MKIAVATDENVGVAEALAISLAWSGAEASPESGDRANVEHLGEIEGA